LSRAAPALRRASTLSNREVSIGGLFREILIAPRHYFLGIWRRGDGLARAEEGSGEESARASAFFFEKIGGYKIKIIHMWDYTSILRHGAIVDKVII